LSGGEQQMLAMAVRAAYLGTESKAGG